MSDTEQSVPPGSSGDSSIASAPLVEHLDVEESRIAAELDGISPRTKFAVLVSAFLVVGVVLGVWRNFYFHWFEVHSGTINEAGPYYAFWSGFGSDLGEATIVVGIVATWRHHNCHVKGCARLGRRVDGTPYLACPRHHPDHQGVKRSVPLEELLGAHRKAETPRQH